MYIHFCESLEIIDIPYTQDNNNIYVYMYILFGIIMAALNGT